MSLTRTVRSFMIRRFASESAMLAARQKAEARRLALGRPHEVYYFHQPDDPYSQLAVQTLASFVSRYQVQLLPRIVAGASAIAIHDPALWDAWARRECALMAEPLGLVYRNPQAQPGPELLALAQRILLQQEGLPDFAEIAQQVSSALQAQDLAALEALARAHGALADARESAERLAANAQLRHRLGHYLGAMFYFAGEWYWGVDRLHYLEERLDALGARRPGATAGHTKAQNLVAARWLKADAPKQQLEFFTSLRSPYSHLSYGRVAELCRRFPLNVVVRPVIPMMMRGVKADRRKGRYIIFDTAREARRLGIPFGNVWDPFGKPVLRAYSLFPWARDQGRGFEYLAAYSTAVWAERVNAWSLAGLRMIVERAGLDWQEALKHLDNRDWLAEIENNASEMIQAGSWGVPSFRLAADASRPELLVWGQDRLWLLEAELARRCAAPAQS